MQDDPELSPVLTMLTLRAEAAHRYNTQLLNENERLRRCATAQMEQMHEIGRAFLPLTRRINYPGFGSSSLVARRSRSS